MQITLNIPDDKLDFFMELFKNLGLIKSSSNSNVLTNEQIQLVEAARRKAKEKPDSLVEWDTALQKIDWDAC